MEYRLPIISVNGVIGAQISPLDRGFAYGDGVFETCALSQGKIPLWDLHRERLINTCQQLFLPLDIDSIELALKEFLLPLPSSLLTRATLKIMLSRGEGGRGYRAPEPTWPTLVIGLFPAPEYPQDFTNTGVRVCLCNHRLSRNPALAGLKHLNRLEQVLARQEWQDASIAEGVLLDAEGNLVECVFSNLFLVKAGVLYTPVLDQAGVAGIMRRLILERLAPILGLTIKVAQLQLSDLLAADEVFSCNSLYGIWPVKELVAAQGKMWTPGAITLQLQKTLSEYLQALGCD